MCECWWFHTTTMEGDGDNLQRFQSRRGIGSRQSLNTTGFYGHGSAQARWTQKESVSLDVLGCWLTWFEIVLFVLASRCATTVCLSVCLLLHLFTQGVPNCLSLCLSLSVTYGVPKLSVCLCLCFCSDTVSPNCLSVLCGPDGH